MTNLLTIPSTLLSFFKLRPPTLRSDYGNRVSFLDALDRYYAANGLYDPELGTDAYLGTWNESMKSLRTCGHRCVEFYVSKLEPGTSLPITTVNENLIETIEQVWQWSNFFPKKSVIVRQYALYGDTFIKSSTDAEKKSVYQEFFPPRFVVDFTEDKKGNITYIRLDIPNGEDGTYTEIWRLEGYATYIHNMGAGADLTFLGKPITQGTLTSLGIDFIPFSHARFIDVGSQWGSGCFFHALDKIDEANRMATRMHEMLFRYNKPLWVALANAMDAQGKPLPPPKVGGSTSTLTVEDDTILSMPGMSTLEPLIPNIHYADALAILQDQMHELERDLPELAYFDLKAVGAISGKAVQTLLGDAVDKVLEARANFEAALVKSNKHAITLGSAAGIFSGLGTYEDGALDHVIADRPVFPMDENERAATVKAFTDAGISLGLAMKRAGFDEDTIELELIEQDAKDTKAQANLAESLSSFNRGA